jgi:hypothetical protein
VFLQAQAWGFYTYIAAFYNMPTAPLTPNLTLAKLLVTKFVITVKQPHVLLLTPTQLKRVRNVAPVPKPKCKKTRNNPPNNFLYF